MKLSQEVQDIDVQRSFGAHMQGGQRFQGARALHTSTYQQVVLAAIPNVFT